MTAFDRAMLLTPEPLTERQTGLIISFARHSYRWEIIELLEDPSRLLSAARPIEPKPHINGYRDLGAALGFDFDQLLEEVGSNYQRERLYDIEHGRIPPEPKQRRGRRTR